MLKNYNFFSVYQKLDIIIFSSHLLSVAAKCKVVAMGILGFSLSSQPPNRIWLPWFTNHYYPAVSLIPDICQYSVDHWTERKEVLEG